MHLNYLSKFYFFVYPKCIPYYKVVLQKKYLASLCASVGIQQTTTTQYK